MKEREETQTDRDTERQRQRQRGREQASKQAGAHHKTWSSFVRSLLISIKNMVSIAGVDDVTEQAEACEEHGTDGITNRPVVLPSSLRVVVYILLVTFDEYFSAESLGWD